MSIMVDFPTSLNTNEFKSDFTCGVCREDEPKDLVCHNDTEGKKHPIHKECIKGWFRTIQERHTSPFTCPDCRVTIDISGFLDAPQPERQSFNSGHEFQSTFFEDDADLHAPLFLSMMESNHRGRGLFSNSRQNHEQYRFDVPFGSRQEGIRFGERQRHPFLPQLPRVNLHNERQRDHFIPQLPRVNLVSDSLRDHLHNERQRDHFIPQLPRVNLHNERQRDHLLGEPPIENPDSDPVLEPFAPLEKILYDLGVGACKIAEKIHIPVTLFMLESIGKVSFQFFQNRVRKLTNLSSHQEMLAHLEIHPLPVKEKSSKAGVQRTAPVPLSKAKMFVIATLISSIAFGSFVLLEAATTLTFLSLLLFTASCYQICLRRFAVIQSLPYAHTTG